MWCLARILPLMIGKEISEADGHWSNYLVLLEILDYVFAPTVTCEADAHLRVLIDDHHQHYKVLCPNSPITPKMHYTVHYPDVLPSIKNLTCVVLAGMDLLFDLGA